MNMSIKKGDNVVVITGKDKGKQGRVVDVLPESGRITVEGVNIVKKHQKPKNQQEKGGIVSKIAPIDASNCMVVCPSCGKASRIAHKTIDGKKVRICKKCGTSLDKEYVKTTKKEAKKATAENKIAASKKVAQSTATVKAQPNEKTTAKPAAEKTVKIASAKAKPAVKPATAKAKPAASAAPKTEKAASKSTKTTKVETQEKTASKKKA